MKAKENDRKKEVFLKVLLVMVAFLLALNIAAHFGKSPPSYAAKVKEYKVFKYWSGKSKPSIEVQMQTALDRAGSEGWELVTLDGRNHVLIFTK